LDSQELAARHIALRERAGLTQEQEAKMAGVSPTTISGIESGKITRPHLRTLLKISQALGADIGELRESGKVEAPHSLTEWLEERCGHAYLALPKAEFEEMFDRLPEDARERRELALEVNREYNTFCKFPKNVPRAERLSMRRMIRAAIPEVAVKHGIALMEGGLERDYQEEAARIFEVQSATESASA
jgi:transcriptional regulator with XRE-family HTH domain